jgi:hypothetical protein
MDIAAWLGSLGLERYEPAFRENDIDAAVLPDLTPEDLTNIGVTSVGHRRRLLAAIAQLRSGVSAAQEPQLHKTGETFRPRSQARPSGAS